MKKVITFLLSGVLIWLVAKTLLRQMLNLPTLLRNCQAPDAQTAQQTQNDATSEVQKAAQC